MHIAKCRRGREREADRLNWVCCSPPTTLRGLRAPKVQSACFSPPPPLLFRSDSSEFNEPHDLYESFSYIFFRSLLAQSVSSWEEGLLDQPREAVEKPPYVGGTNHFTLHTQRLHASLEASILDSSPRSLAAPFPVPYQRFKPPSLLVDFCQN